MYRQTIFLSLVLGASLESNQAYAGGVYERTIFLSFDGMHQFDLVDYISKYPGSTWASLIPNSIVYSNARASTPSDSLPATAALFSGATSHHSGIFWEQSYDRTFYPGGSGCTGPPGIECDYSEACDLDSSALDGGGGFNLTCLPQRKLPSGTCETVYPHEFIYVNTVFNVARDCGLVTAWADKHLSYAFLNGPSGNGLTQGYFPEIASIDDTLEATEAWDDLHWSALRNWTEGNWANGTHNPAGAPALYGANFQAITWAQQNAGYLDASGAVPNVSLAEAFQAADQQLGAFIDFLKAADMLDTTLLLIGSKQGQGPINPKTEVVIDPQDIVDGAGVPVAFFVGEDGGIMYLENSSDAATAAKNLLANNSLGIAYVLYGDAVAAAGYGSPLVDARTPDLIIGADVGTLWNDPFEFEDHGGFLPQDLNVPLIAYNPKLKAANITEIVYNRQVASTLLQALGLPLAQLDAYCLGDSPILPGLFE